jgi:hypothetical protein
MSESATLKTLFPVPYDVTLAGRPVKVGRLKLRQKAELQAWLDSLPEPNARVRESLKEAGQETWPLSLSGLTVFTAIDWEARRKFLAIALAPYNPGLAPESLAGIIDESEDEDEFLAILRVAYGRGPNEAEQPSDPKAADGASGAS